MLDYCDNDIMVVAFSNIKIYISMNFSETSEVADDNEELDLFMTQSLPEEHIVIDGCKYGFANNDTGVFSVLQVG